MSPDRDRDTYLSIDLDFWDCFTWNLPLTEQESRDLLAFRSRLFTDIFARKLPCTFVVNHNDMVSHINNGAFYPHLINLDFHSDITALPSVELDEGTVFDNIINPQERTFTWIYPYKELGKKGSLGRCDTDRNPDDAFARRNWVYASQRKTKNRRLIDLDTVAEVGICLSPNWVSKKTALFFQDAIINHPAVDREMFKEHLEKLMSETDENK